MLREKDAELAKLAQQLAAAAAARGAAEADCRAQAPGDNQTCIPYPNLDSHRDHEFSFPNTNFSGQSSSLILNDLSYQYIKS